MSDARSVVVGGLASGFREAIFRSAAAEAEVMADYDTVLSQWPVPYDTTTISTRLGRTSVVSSGAASSPHLVLLHGAGTHAMSWVVDVATYAQHFRTHAIDMPGDPGRSDAIRADWRTPAYAQWLVDVLDGLGVGRTRLVGISQGGWNALSFATRFPERVDSLVLLAPSGVCHPRVRFLMTALPLQLFGARGRRLVDHVIAGGSLDRTTMTFVDHLADGFRSRVGLPPIFTDDALSRLRMPLLLMVGDCDVVFPATRVAARIRRLVPHATVVIVRGASHVLLGTAAPVTNFLTVGSPIQRVLAEHDATARPGNHGSGSGTLNRGSTTTTHP